MLRGGANAPHPGSREFPANQPCSIGDLRRALDGGAIACKTPSGEEGRSRGVHVCWEYPSRVYKAAQKLEPVHQSVTGRRGISTAGPDQGYFES